MVIHVEIPLSDIHKFIDIKLKAAGIDPGKEMKKWTRLDFEHDDLVLIYEQETDAPAPAPAPAPVPVKADACARPSYLKGYQNG